jgi:hypothetical protein
MSCGSLVEVYADWSYRGVDDFAREAHRTLALASFVSTLVEILCDAALL